MKNFAIILTCALLIGTISGCTTSDTSSTSTETSTTTSEKNYPRHFFPIPDGFEAYYHDKKLDVPFSETESTEKVEQFFEASANKDFSKISDYSDNFFNETQDEITNSTFMAEDMYNMTLKRI